MRIMLPYRSIHKAGSPEVEEGYSPKRLPFVRRGYLLSEEVTSGSKGSYSSNTNSLDQSNVWKVRMIFLAASMIMISSGYVWR